MSILKTLFLTICTSCFLFSLSYAAECFNNKLIMLDSGHSALERGAISIKGIPEVTYNDHFIQKLYQALTAAKCKVDLTRTPIEEMSLEARAQKANQKGAALFLSIHHDSAQSHFLEKFPLNQHEGYKTKKLIRGYSVFVSRKKSSIL